MARSLALLSRTIGCGLAMTLTVLSRLLFQNRPWFGLKVTGMARIQATPSRTTGCGTAMRLIVWNRRIRLQRRTGVRSAEHSSELQYLMRILYAVYSVKK